MWRLALVLLLGAARMGVAATGSTTSDGAIATTVTQPDGTTTNVTFPQLSDGITTDLPVTALPDGPVVPPMPQGENPQ